MITEKEFRTYLEFDKYRQPHVALLNILFDKHMTRANLPPGARFLDIGCGRGTVLERMAERGFAGMGIDLQEICVEISRRLISKANIQIQKGHFNDLSETFDLIIMTSLLEHIEDDRSALRKIHTLLNPKGYFLFSVPGDMRLFGERDIAYGHYRRYEKTDLLDKLREAGLEINTLWSYGMNAISKLYRMLIRSDIKTRLGNELQANTTNSAIGLDGFDKIKRLYPIYSRLMFFYNFQIFFLNTNWFRSNYIGLCRKI